MCKTMWKYNEETNIWECTKAGIAYCLKEEGGAKMFWRKDKPEMKWQSKVSKEEIYHLLSYNYFEEL